MKTYAGLRGQIRKLSLLYKRKNALSGAMDLFNDLWVMQNIFIYGKGTSQIVLLSWPIYILDTRTRTEDALSQGALAYGQSNLFNLTRTYFPKAK